jgi:hypothetical protein
MVAREDKREQDLVTGSLVDHVCVSTPKDAAGTASPASGGLREVRIQRCRSRDPECVRNAEAYLRTFSSPSMKSSYQSRYLTTALGVRYPGVGLDDRTVHIPYLALAPEARFLHRISGKRPQPQLSSLRLHSEYN